jgi:biofilm protein TabA
VSVSLTTASLKQLGEDPAPGRTRAASRQPAPKGHRFHAGMLLHVMGYMEGVHPVIAGSLEALDPAIRRWPAVLEILRRAADPALLRAPLGRHAIDGDRHYLVLNEYDTRPAAEGLPETHRQLCDVQVVLRGEERIGWAPLSAAWAPRGAYDPAADLQLHEPREGLSWLRAAPGQFLLLLPTDVHQPGVALAAPARVRKLVGKVHRSLLEP